MDKKQWIKSLKVNDVVIRQGWGFYMADLVEEVLKPGTESKCGEDILVKAAGIGYNELGCSPTKDYWHWEIEPPPEKCKSLNDTVLWAKEQNAKKYNTDMTHYIRNQYNETIVDCETTEDDIHCVVVLKPFCEFLLSQDTEKYDDVIRDFDSLQEIRGLYFEVIPLTKTSPAEYVKLAFTQICEKYNLTYSTD